MHYVLFQVFGVMITGWKIIGYIGILLFTSRWLTQLYASKKAGKPIITRWFWLLSLSGSSFLLIYFIFGKNDSIGILSNSFPAFIALYNLFLDVSHAKKEKYISAVNTNQF